MSPTFRFLLGLVLPLVVAPLAAWWTLSVHEPHCAWGEAFWNGDLPAGEDLHGGEGPVRGLLLGSSRMGAGVDVVQLSEGTGLAWQRVARHTLSGNALLPSYPGLLGSSAARPELDVLVVEVSPLLVDEVSCGRPPIPHIPLRAFWFGEADRLGLEGRASALAMSILPHRWLAGSGRRHDLIEHLRSPRHALQAVADLRYGTRATISRWPGEPAPELTPENAQKRRAFLLGRPMTEWVPEVNGECLVSLERTVRAARAKRSFFVVLPMRPMLRATIEADYDAAARLALRELAGRLPRTALLDYSTRFDAEPAAFNDFDHLNGSGAATFTAELSELFQ